MSDNITIEYYVPYVWKGDYPGLDRSSPGWSKRLRQAGVLFLSTMAYWMAPSPSHGEIQNINGSMGFDVKSWSLSDILNDNLNDRSAGAVKTNSDGFGHDVGAHLRLSGSRLLVADFNEPIGDIGQKDSGECRNSNACSIKRLEEMPERDRYKVIAAAFFLIGVFVLAAYLFVKRDGI